MAITTIGGNVSPDKLQSLKTKVEQTKGKLESNDQAQLASITREDILGDLFYAGALGYFAEFNALSHVSNLQSNSYSNLLPSFGTYGYEPQVSYFFGLPRSIETGGIAMDLDSVTSVVAVSDGDEAKRINTAFQLGVLSSALEHAIPEQMFSTADNPADAISAVKALQKASIAGQRIYHITNANKGVILPNIHHNSLTMSEIRDALNSGKEVITHTDAVNVPGWSGAGYILFDPDTGSGAYKIGGGKNGAFLSPAEVGVIIVLLAPLWISVSLFNPAMAFAFNLLMGLAVVFLFAAEVMASSGNDVGAEIACDLAYGSIIGALMILFKGPFKTPAFNIVLGTLLTGIIGKLFGDFCPNLLLGV